MLTVYPACFFKEENGYSVVFPDLNDLATCGETLEEAMAMAIDCLAGYVFMGQMEGEAIPAPSKLDAINPSQIAEELEIDPVNAFVNMVAVDVAEYAKTHFEKPVKKTLTIPSWLNMTAQKQNVNFSAILQEALMDHLKVGGHKLEQKRK